MSKKIYGRPVTTPYNPNKLGSGGGGGEDGFSPIAKVTQTTAGAVIEITDKEGITSATVNHGEPGKTPVRGEDYWTEADKAEIVEDVLGSIELPTGGGSTNLALLQSADIAGIASVVATPPSPVSTVVIVVKGAKNKTGASTLGVKIDNVYTPCSFSLGKDGTGEKWGYAIMKFNGALWEIYKAPESSNGISAGLLNAQMPYYTPKLFASAPASRIEVYIGSTADDYLPTGGTIEIYGG